MATAVAITLDTTPWRRSLDQLAKRGPVALARALNKTAASERTAMARAVSADMGLKVATARNAITVKRATAARLSAQVVARGKRLPLIDFKASGTLPSRGKGRGVSYVMQGKRKRIAHAFLAYVGGSGRVHKGVFIRAMGANRRGPLPHRSQLPIKELYGVSIARSFQNQLPAGEARRTQVLLSHVAHEIQFELSRLRA